MFEVPSLLLVLLLLSSGVETARAVGYYVNNDDDKPVNVLDCFEAIGPHIFAICLVSVGLHLLIQPSWHMLDLMETYLKEGTPVEGIVLDCKSLQSPPSTLSRFFCNSAVCAMPPETHLVEVMWECPEHKFENEPKMKARFPGEYEVKKFVGQFKVEREVAVGSLVPIILPRGVMRPRSGFPREIAEEKFDQERQQQFKLRIILAIGLAFLAILVGLAVPEILEKMEDPKHGLMVLVTAYVLSEGVSILYFVGIFYENKEHVFDGGRLMETKIPKPEREWELVAVPPTSAETVQVEYAGLTPEP